MLIYISIIYLMFIYVLVKYCGEYMKNNILNILRGGASKTKNSQKAVESGETLDQCKSLQDCAAALKKYGAAVAVLQLEDLQAFWLGIMHDKKASVKDKLSASKLYAQSIGAFDRREAGALSGGATYKWAGSSRAAVEAEIVHEARTGKPEAAEIEEEPPGV